MKNSLHNFATQTQMEGLIMDNVRYLIAAMFHKIPLFIILPLFIHRHNLNDGSSLRERPNFLPIFI